MDCSVTYKPVKCIEQIRKDCTGLKGGEARYFKINSCIGHVFPNNTATEICKESFLYPGCSYCLGKIVEQHGSFVCQICQKVQLFISKYRYRLRVKLGNCSKDKQLEDGPEVEAECASIPYQELRVTLFDDPADYLMGMSASQVVDCLQEKRGQKIVKDTFDNLLDSNWQVKVRVKSSLKEDTPVSMIVKEVLGSLDY